MAGSVKRVIAGTSLPNDPHEDNIEENPSILLDSLRTGVDGDSSLSTAEMPIPHIALPSDQIVHKSSRSHILADMPSPTHLLPPPSTAGEALQKWNDPKINVWRILSTFFSFVVMGANDAAYGALIPYLEEYYNVSYTVISLVFLSPCVGYIASALSNNFIHVKLGQRGVAMMAPSCKLVAYTIACLHPTYGALVIGFIIAGYGNGLEDAAWNAWMGDMANANELLGCLHGFYGIGAALSPLIATTLITKARFKWYEFYYLMVGIAFLELIFCVLSFWKADAAEFRAQHSRHTAPQPVQQPKKRKFLPGSKSQERDETPNSTVEAIKSNITWLCALFLLVYVGIEVSVGGWIVTFMLRVRHGSAFASGLSSTGFWLGVTVGRFVLGFVTARGFRNEKQAIAVYLVACMALQLMFWLIPHFNVSAVLVSFLGFFVGPFFPAAVVVATKLLPKHLHVAAVGFAAAFGATGACVFPFAVGAIAQSRGVQVLQPIILAMLAVDLGIWLMIPALPKRRSV